MIRRALAAAALAGGALLLVGCAGEEPPRSRRSPAETGAREILLRYAPDGWPLARAALDARLAAEFRAADADGDGRVSYGEAERLNDARRGSDGVVAGRIVDWNQDGVVSFDEFAGAARGAFASIDADEDGVATEAEANRPEGLAEPRPDERPAEPRRRKRGL